MKEKLALECALNPGLKKYLESIGVVRPGVIDSAVPDPEHAVEDHTENPSIDESLSTEDE